MTTTSTLTATPAPAEGGPDDPVGTAPARTMRIGRIVLASLATGLVAAVLLVLAPFGPATESAAIGSVLCGFAVGWAMLGLLSARFSAQPQRWAFVPAVVMGLGGLVLVAFGATVQGTLNWIWPPVTLAVAAWMFVRVHRGIRDRFARWLLYPVIAALALASVGGGYQTIGAAADAQAYPMPGKLVDVGGHSLHLHCTGSGSPTVVVEPGGGQMSSDLGLITPAVAADTRVCVYDRAGRGWSEASPTAAHGVQMATELHTLLERVHETGPFVLAGHSFGGLYVQSFAARYPSEVAGMVLIDSTAPNAKATANAVPFVLQRTFAAISAVADLGLIRLAALMDTNESLPHRAAGESNASVATAHHLRSTIDEYATAGDSARAAASLTDFGDKPLVVLTATVGNDASWFRSQDRLAALSTNSSHRVIDGVDHPGMTGDPDGAAATTHAILEVVSSVRNSTPVSK